MPEFQLLDGDLLLTIPTIMNEHKAIEAAYPAPEQFHTCREMIDHYLTSSMYQCFKIGKFNDFNT
jgi:hypothetical protein